MTACGFPSTKCFSSCSQFRHRLPELGQIRTEGSAHETTHFRRVSSPTRPVAARRGSHSALLGLDNLWERLPELRETPAYVHLLITKDRDGQPGGGPQGKVQKGLECRGSVPLELGCTSSRMWVSWATLELIRSRCQECSPLPGGGSVGRSHL